MSEEEEIIVSEMPLLQINTVEEIVEPQRVASIRSTHLDNEEEVKLEEQPTQQMKEISELVHASGKVSAIQKIKGQLKDMGMTVDQIFEMCDKDNSGKVSIREIGITFDKMRIADTLSIMRLYDTDHDNNLDREEFAKVFDLHTLKVDQKDWEPISRPESSALHMADRTAGDSDDEIGELSELDYDELNLDQAYVREDRPVGK